jgi:WD40 repeat protein
MTDRIDIWDTNTARREGSLTSRNSGYDFYCSTPYSSSDGTYIAAVGQRGKDKERALLVWKTGDIPAPMVIEPGTKITSYELKFSEDERYIAADSRKTVVVFDTRTGKQEFQINDRRRVPDMWLANNSVFLYYNMTDLYTVRVPEGAPLFRKDLIYKSSNNDDSTTTEIDYTYAIPNAKRDLVLTYSNRHINVFDAKSGNTSPTLFGLEPKRDKSLFRKATDVVLFREDDSTSLFTKAGWASDDIIYVVDGRTLSLWKREN